MIHVFLFFVSFVFFIGVSMDSSYAATRLGSHLNITNPTTTTAFLVTQQNNLSSSTSIGGAMRLINTLNSGAGFIAYTNFGAGATGRLMNLRCDNANFDQSCLNINYDGTVDAFTVNAQQNNSVGMSAADISSTNRNHTALGVSGYERAHGTIKVDHKHDSSIDSSDANAAAISINLDGSGTAAQGLYIYSDGNTSGNLISLNNKGVRPLFVDEFGSLFMRFAANISLGHGITPDNTLNVNGTGLFRNFAAKNALTIEQRINVGNNLYKGALVVNNTGNNDTGLLIFSNSSSPSTGSASLLRIEVENENYDAPIVRINSNSTSSQGLIRLDSITPEIEYVETDQVAPDGKFETRVQDKRFQINSRNAADNSFENLFLLRAKQEWSSGDESLVELIGNVSSTTSDFIELANHRNSATTSIGIVWTNINAPLDMARIHVKGGASFLKPEMFLAINGTNILSLNTNQIVTNRTLNLTSNNLTQVDYGFFDKGIQMNGINVCLQNGTNCQSSTASNETDLIVWTNTSIETKIKTGYPQNVSIYGTLNITDISNTGSLPSVSIRTGSGATNFLDFNNNFYMGKQTDVFGFHTYSSGEVIGMATQGVLNVFNLNGGTGTATVIAQNQVRLNTVNDSANANITTNIIRFKFNTGNKTHLPISFGIGNDGIYATENQIRMVIDSRDVFNMTGRELDLGERNITTPYAKFAGEIINITGHRHTGVVGDGEVIPHNQTRPVRDFNTVYQAGSRARIIYVSLNAQTSLLVDPDDAFGTAYIGTASPPVTKVGEVGLHGISGLSINQTSMMTIIVQANEFYTINRTTAGSGALNIAHWNEVEL